MREGTNFKRPNMPFSLSRVPTFFRPGIYFEEVGNNDPLWLWA